MMTIMIQKQRMETQYAGKTRQTDVLRFVSVHESLCWQGKEQKRDKTNREGVL